MRPIAPSFFTFTKEIAELRIDRATSPISSPVGAREHHRGFQAHGRERPVIVRASFGVEQCVAVLLMLRRNLGYLAAAEAQSRERGRLDGERLGGRVPLAGHVSFGHQTLLDRIDGLSAAPIEHEHQAGLAGLDHRGDL